MEFIGTEVGIKIRSAIKAKLTELGKTVDDELIDYIMVMVANKKEEMHMARDLQPFLESDTIKFTSWLHKVLQKLEQVTVIVTDEEFKIATTAFSKINKKRKSSESSSNTKKRTSSRDEPKEKKKKVKHEHSAKHGKGVSGEATKSALKDNSKVKNTSSSSTNVVKVKAKKSKLSVSDIGSNIGNTVNKSVAPSVTVKSVGSEKISPVKETDSSNLTKKNTTSEVLSKTTTSNVIHAVVPVQRPVMMVSDDDDDDDDFINIKTDVAEEDELLDEEQAQRSVAALSDDPPAVQQQEEVLETPTPVAKVQSVVETVKISEPVKSQVVIEEVAVKPIAPTAAPRSVVSSVVSTVASTVRRTVKPQHQNVLTERKPPKPSILSRVGAVLKRKASHLSDEEEEDEVRNGSVASVVQVKPRPKPPPGSQAPKNLLLRAMADAHRSVATTPVREEPEPPPKASRSPLFTRKYRNQERIAVTLPNIRDPSVSEMEEDVTDKEAVLELEPDEAYVPELVTSPSSVPLDVVYSPSPINKATNKQNTAQVEGDQRCATPEFLVTLDGYKNYSGLSRTVVCATGTVLLQEEEQEAEVEEPQQQPAAEVKPKRQKIVFTTKADQGEGELQNSVSKSLAPKSLDRCRFWPACRQGDSCTFHHPTQPCKSFPSCQFGDRCLYIHPNCKFDASCTRKDCPYTHASPRNLASLSAAPILVPRPVVTRISTPLLTCRFFPNCSNNNCRFYHPKPCRYGRQCSKPDCTFSHSEFPPKAKMKWVNSVF